MGEKLKVTIEKMIYGGGGLARTDRFGTIIVSGGIEGEEAIVEIKGKRKGVYHADVIEVISPSPYRIEPECMFFGQCGGCTWQYINYSGQLKFKENISCETIQRIGGFSNIEVEKIIPSPSVWRYRNKMEFAFGKDENGYVFAGLHKKGYFDKLIPVGKHCLLIDENVNRIIGIIEEMASKEIPFDTLSRTGYLRFLTIRKSFLNNNIMIGITTTTAGRSDIYKSWFEEINRALPGTLACGYQVVNPSGSSSEGKVIHLLGEPVITEKIGNFLFKISPESFFQVNPNTAELLLLKTKEYARLSGNEHLWDLFCGVGTIGIFMANDSLTVLGIEATEKAITDARKNAEINNIKNAEFLCGDVSKTLSSATASNRNRPDIIIIDPPRMGLTRKTIEKIVQISPKKIIYISCNPSTLARDAAIFNDSNFVLRKACPVDMFPQTHHIECVALLEKE